MVAAQLICKHQADDRMLERALQVLDVTHEAEASKRQMRFVLRVPSRMVPQHSNQRKTATMEFMHAMGSAMV